MDKKELDKLDRVIWWGCFFFIIMLLYFLKEAPTSLWVLFFGFVLAVHTLDWVLFRFWRIDLTPGSSEKDVPVNGFDVEYRRYYRRLRKRIEDGSATEEEIRLFPGITDLVVSLGLYEEERL